MQAIHQPLFPGTAVHHSLFLDHFTPSTIYPYPQPAWIRQYGLSSSEGAEGIQIKIVGNLIVAGGSELRVFEVREEPILLGDLDEGDSSDLVDGNVKVENEPQMDAEMGDDDGFRNIGDTFMTQVSSSARRDRAPSTSTISWTKLCYLSIERNERSNST
jgi:cleavage and polyadenylation specificity factor subunit 1